MHARSDANHRPTQHDPSPGGREPHPLPPQLPQSFGQHTPRGWVTPVLQSGSGGGGVATAFVDEIGVVDSEGETDGDCAVLGSCVASDSDGFPASDAVELGNRVPSPFGEVGPGEI